MNGGPTVLIVDDSDAHRRLTRLAVESLGCSVAEAADGQEALAYLAQHTPDVCLFDVHMPGMTGPELAARLRALRRELRHVPLYFLTALASDEVRRQASEVGASGLLHKPASRQELQSALAPWLGQGADAEEEGGP